jgi:membrane protease YdiL (CAAX protease family)
VYADQGLRVVAATARRPRTGPRTTDLQAAQHQATGIVLPMTDAEPGRDPDAPASGSARPPARPPGPIPAGYVPREWVQAAPPPPTHWSVTGPAPAPPVVNEAVLPPAMASAPPAYPMVAPGAVPGGAVALPPGYPVAGGPAQTPDVPFLDTPWVPPQTKRQGWIWLVYGVAGFLAGQLGALLFGVIAGAIAGKTSAQMQAIATASVPPEWYVVSTLLGLWIGFFGAPWLASRTQGTRNFVRDLGVRFRVIDLVGIGIGIGGQVAVALMYAPFQHEIHDFNGPSQRLTGGSHGGGFIVIAIATVVFAPAMEELFFRGLLLKALVRLFTPFRIGRSTARTVGVVAAVVADGLLFGLAHGEWIQLAGLAFFGMVLAAVSYRTGRLGMNMVAHATFNLIAILAILSQGNGVIF